MEENPKTDQKSAVELLHNQKQLQSLRTYQGDIAEAIKRQNESVATIAIKEHARKQQTTSPTQTNQLSNLPTSMVKLFLGLILIAGSIFALLFVLGTFQTNDATQITIEKSLIDYNNRLSLNGLDDKNLLGEIDKISSPGTTIIDIETTDGQKIGSARELFSIFGLNLPPSLARNLKEEFAFGLYTKEAVRTPFVIIKIADFGSAFAGMLEWESTLPTNLSSIFKANEDTIYSWQDLIIKNKDVRAYAESTNSDNILIGYTFLDKNTILITGRAEAIADLSAIYASHSVVK